MRTLIFKEKAKKVIPTAVSILKKGGIIIYPTETQYGIGADATSRKAVKKVFLVKQRPSEKKVIWAFSDIKMIKKYVHLEKKQERLIKRLMPGPFTLVIKWQGFRIPDNKTAIKIIRKFGRPITTTSANISGEKTPTKIKDVIKLFDGKVDMIIDAGDLKRNKPSTVFGWDKMKIFRRGPVTKKQIMNALK